jgi:hypothetical protein
MRVECRLPKVRSESRTQRAFGDSLRGSAPNFRPCESSFGAPRLPNPVLSPTYSGIATAFLAPVATFSRFFTDFLPDAPPYGPRSEDAAPARGNFRPPADPYPRTRRTIMKGHSWPTRNLRPPTRALPRPALRARLTTRRLSPDTPIPPLSTRNNPRATRNARS